MVLIPGITEGDGGRPNPVDRAALELLLAHGADLTRLHDGQSIVDLARWNYDEAIAWLEARLKS